MLPIAAFVIGAAALGIGALSAVGCSGGERAQHDRGRGREPERTGEAERAPRDEGAGGYETIEVVNGGTITGTVTWSGERPEPITIPVPSHGEHCGATRTSPALEIGRRGGVASTVVWLEGIRAGRALEVPEAPIAVELADCSFRPHVSVVPVGARIAFRNEEGILHNVHASWVDRTGASQPWLSEGLPVRGSSHVAEVARPGVARLVDDAAHPWMLGWIHAFAHPYYAVSDADGRFQLQGIPPGRYVLRAWHEGFRVSGATESGRPVYSAPILLSRPLTVTSGHDTTVDFVIGAETADAAGD